MTQINWKDIELYYVEGFTNRTTNSLWRSDIKTLGKLVKFNKHELKDIPGVGDKTVKEIEEVLYGCGLTLKEAPYNEEKKYSQQDIKDLINK